MAFDITKINDIADVAGDIYNGKALRGNFSVEDGEKLVYNALVDANNGKDHLDPRDIRDGKCATLFALVETIIKKTVVEGVRNDPFLNKILDTRVVKAGDKPVFKIKDSNWYTVSEVAPGNQALRRQRIVGTEEVTIPTRWHAVKIYEEMERLLGSMASMTESMGDVSKSFNEDMWNQIATIWQGLTQDQIGGTTYDITGSWNEDAMVRLIQHVEAKTGQRAAVYGTKLGLSKMTSGVTADSAKEDVYNIGYYGKFRGTNLVEVPQRHKVGTDDFLFNDNVLTVIAGPAKPVKLVIEGNPLINLGSYFDNQDLTQDYVYGQKYGVGYVAAAGQIGRNTLS